MMAFSMKTFALGPAALVIALGAFAAPAFAQAPTGAEPWELRSDMGYHFGLASSMASWWYQLSAQIDVFAGSDMRSAGRRASP